MLKHAGRWVGAPFRVHALFPGNAITQAGTFTLLHNLRGIPRLVVCTMVCVTAELGYVAGDRVSLAIGPQAAADRGVTIEVTRTTIIGRFGAATIPIELLHATSGVTTVIILNRWVLDVEIFV